jgi:hypothetical protein
MSKAVTFVEIDVDRCSNTFGNSPCAAVLGVGNDAAYYWNFDTNSNNSFTGFNATLTASASGMTVTQTGADPDIRSPALLSIDGSKYWLVVMDWERITNGASFQGALYYSTAGHGETGSFFHSFADTAVGVRTRTVIDMSALTAGGTDWIASIITQLRFDFDNTALGSFKIHSIRICAPGVNYKCYNSLKTCADRVHLAAQTETLRFSMSSQHYPLDIDAVPNMTGISFSPGTISLGGDLGQRATLTVQFLDHPHPDTGPGGDRYLSSRGFDPWTKGTFWSKFRARFPYLQGRILRIYRGYDDQDLADMDIRYYVMDSFDGPTPNGQFTIVAKDILKLADDDKSQAPKISSGFLSADLTNVATSATMQPTGVGALYPASGYVNIGGSEICAFTRSGDVLTLTRGQFNTVAVAHSSQDRVQQCLYYNAQTPANIIYDLLVTYADVPASFINLSQWQTEVNNYLQRSYTALIAEPTGVNKLISELIEQAALAVWWDDSSQKINLSVLRQISTSATTVSEEIVNSGSVTTKEQPDKRLSQIWTYYALINPLVDITDTSNFRSVELALAAQLEADYGTPSVKQIFSRWIPQFGRSIATRLNTLILGRYQVPPRLFSFESFGPISDYLTLGGGYNMQFRTLRDAQGDPITVPFQITRLNPDFQKYQIEAEEALFAPFSQADLNTRIIVIDTSVNDFNLKTVHDQLFPPIVDPTGITVTCIIQSGVIVGNNQALQGVTGRGVAFTVGAFPFGTDITIQLDGDIRAGGGYGAQSIQNWANGQVGGTGIKTTLAIKIRDTTGRSIRGGGGGGGSAYSTIGLKRSHGGGGGAGQLVGPGGFGQAGNDGGSGLPGTLSAGGAGWHDPYGYGYGGDGGAPGQAGTVAFSSTAASGSGFGTPGAAGRSIDGIAFVTYTNLTPTLAGPTV